MKEDMRHLVGFCWLGALLASLPASVPASVQVRDDLPDGSTRITLRFPRGLGMPDVVLLADGSLMSLESPRDDRGSRYGARPVDMAALERVFYDDLCRPKPGEPCLVDECRAPACQPYSECVAPKGENQGVCQAKCRGEEQDCKRSEDCCQGLVCDMLHQCAPCAAKGKSCREDKSCCPGLTCDKKSRTCQPRSK